MSQIQYQREYYDRVYRDESLSYLDSTDPLVRFVTDWRIQEALRRLQLAAGRRVDLDTPILVMCAGGGGEGSALCNLGFRDVTVSDISAQGVTAALERDRRLKGLVLNAQQAQLADGSFGVVLIQDGLHHLPSPVQGFTEMLRLASVAVVFLEPHDGMVGQLIGTKWERGDNAVNYVFRWTRKLVEDVANSYLGPDSFHSFSFSFWHHNLAFERFGKAIGGGPFAVKILKGLKKALDLVAAKAGNQFCGLILRIERNDGVEAKAA